MKKIKQFITRIFELVPLMILLLPRAPNKDSEATHVGRQYSHLPGLGYLKTFSNQENQEILGQYKRGQERISTKVLQIRGGKDNGELGRR